MKVKSQIPNLITLSNLLCGALAIYFVSQNNPAFGALFILGGAFLDFFDGLAARALGVAGEMGKQLDSLADMVSFGLAPAFIAIYLAGAFEVADIFSLWKFTPIIIAPFAAYRLAKFNLDERQSVDFIGLASPSNALFWLSIPLILTFSDLSTSLGSLYLEFSQSVVAINIAAVILSVLMVSEIRFFSLKFKSRKWAENYYKIIFVAGSILLLLIFGVQAIPIILLLYFILSIIYHITRK